MPQSVRDQIMEAIAKAGDEAQRAMLLVMLALADTMGRVEHVVTETADELRSLKGDLDTHVGEFKKHDKWEKEWRDSHFRGIPAEEHVDHHGVVKEIVGERRKTAEVVHEARKGFAGQAGKMAAIALFSLIAGAAGALGAMKIFSGG